MKDPKALFPYLFASAWLGNLFLTVLAFFLAFSSSAPLSPLLFLTVAACILSGNLLPIGVYLVFIRWQSTELAAEKTEADLLLRSALRRSEEILERLDATEGSLSKGILMARQVPERIRESLESVDNLASRLDTLQLESFTETLSLLSGSVEGVQSSSSEMRAIIGEMSRSIGALSNRLNALDDAVASLSSAHANAAKDADLPLAEKLDLLSEALDDIQESLAGLHVPAALPPLAPSQEQEPEPEPEPEMESEPEPEMASQEEVSPPPEDDEQDPGGDLEAESDDQPVAKTGQTAAEQAEMALDIDFNPDDPASGTTRLVAQAMIGIHNRLFIRGDVPWLSWDDGQQMELIGIGEYAWSIDNLREPIEVSLFLNDELAAEGGSILLQPGQTTRVAPRFPK